MFGLFRKSAPSTPRERGEWGENIAVNHLKAGGWSILERNSRPLKSDRRCEIDIIAYFKEDDLVAFVEVKTHLKKSDNAPRLWAVDRRKKSALLRACAAWLRNRHWHGNFRFDVIEVYGTEGGPVEVDHIERVPLFPQNWRFW